jgi:S-formylglutathione hydrolase FrmB
MNSTGRFFVDVNKIDILMDGWIADGQIEEMIVVMPNSGKVAGYRDTEGEPNNNQGPWGSHISIDIRDEIESNYLAIEDPKFRALTGISMGGGEVFSIGMENTDLYTSISSIMGAVGGAVEKIEAVSDEVLADITFYLDCGNQDKMVNPQSTQDTGEYLESRNANVEWELRDGGHNRGFISEGLVNAMRIHSEHFVNNGL